MSRSMADSLQKTHAKHFSENDPSNLRYVYRVPINGAENGNTVEVNYEQGQFGRESTWYAATLQFLESRVGGIRRALAASNKRELTMALIINTNIASLTAQRALHGSRCRAKYSDGKTSDR